MTESNVTDYVQITIKPKSSIRMRRLVSKHLRKLQAVNGSDYKTEVIYDSNQINTTITLLNDIENSNLEVSFTEPYLIQSGEANLDTLSVNTQSVAIIEVKSFSKDEAEFLVATDGATTAVSTSVAASVSTAQAAIVLASLLGSGAMFLVKFIETCEFLSFF